MSRAWLMVVSSVSGGSSGKASACRMLFSLFNAVHSASLAGVGSKRRISTASMVMLHLHGAIDGLCAAGVGAVETLLCRTLIIATDALDTGSRGQGLRSI